MQSMHALQMAKDHIEQNGGLVNAARTELGKRDAQMPSPSDRAQELSRSASELVDDDVTSELAKGKEDTASSLSNSLQDMPLAVSPERGSIWQLLESHAWKSFRQLAAHSQVERIQSQLTSIAQHGTDANLGLHSTLKDADSLARKYMQSGETALQAVSKDFQSLVHDIMQKSADKKEAAAIRAETSMVPTESAETEALHVVGDDDDDDFVWEDDDDLAVAGHPPTELLAAGTTTPAALPASMHSARTERTSDN